MRKNRLIAYILIMTISVCAGCGKAGADSSTANSTVEPSSGAEQDVSGAGQNVSGAGQDVSNAGHDVSGQGQGTGDAKNTDTATKQGADSLVTTESVDVTDGDGQANVVEKGDTTEVTMDSNSGPAEAVTVESVGSSPRTNLSNVLTPTAPGTSVTGNDYVSVDISNNSEGYIVVTYKGSSTNVKFQITGPGQSAYTYKIATGVATVMPLTGGSGSYKLGCYEGIGGNQYAVVYTENVTFNITNTFGPYLYPNQYVNFNSNSKVVTKAASLVSGCDTDLEAVEAVYHYVVKNFTYDYDKAATVSSGYLPVVDTVLDSKTGICFDYAAVMASMLRSQNIPTRLEIGYAGDAYHAWISVYVKDKGWIDGIIKFDGKNWTLMDPTFASTSSSKETKDFITNKSNYTVKYMY